MFLLYDKFHVPANVSYLNFRAVFHVSILRNGVGNDHSFKTGVINPADGRSAEYAVGQNCINFYRPRLHKFICGVANSAASIGHIVDKDSHSILDVSDKDHARYLVSLLPFFVNKGEIYVQTIRNRCYSVEKIRINIML